MKVLVADDDLPSRLIMQKFLEEFGHEVHLCDNGQQAWEACQQEYYPLVLLDWKMPGLDGLELCRRLRGLPQGERSFVIIVTANEQMGQHNFDIDAGADDYLTKPLLRESFNVRLTLAQRQVLKRQHDHQIQHTLQARQERLHEIIQVIPGVLYQYAWLPDGPERFLYLSPGLETVYRLAPETAEAETQQMWQRLHPEDVEAFRQSLQRSSETLEEWKHTHRIIWPDGQIRWIRGVSRPRRQSNGDLVWSGFLVDITELEHIKEALALEHTRLETALEELSESEERWRSALESSGDGIWDWDLRHNQVYLSGKLRGLFGLLPESHTIPAQAWLELICPEDRGFVEMLLQSHWQQKTPMFTSEYRTLSASGEYRWVLSRGKVIHRDETGLALRMVGVYTDLTERKQAEEDLRQLNTELAHTNHELQEAQAQLIQAAKLASLGEMATGIAHEISQPLQVISMNAELAGLNLQDYRLESAQLSIKNIIHQVERISKIINHLRVFAHQSSSLPFKKTDPNLIIEQALILFAGQFSRQRTLLCLELAENLPSIYCNSLQIEQILVNFLSNARDALENRSEQRLWIRTKETPESILWEVQDTGVGMSEEVKIKIFDPFFTTKAVGKGTGLGLSISHGLAQAHGGRIELESEPGVGSLFRLVVPKTPPAHAILEPETGAASPPVVF